jgi:hypothetical protein
MSLSRAAKNGIINGQAFTNASGDNTVIPDLPDTPTIGTATLGAGSGTVTFTPSLTGGVATSFTATATPGGATKTGTSSPITVTNITGDGTSYTIKVKANNASGSSAESAASNSFIPTIQVDLYAFDTFTFTNAGATGSNGPSLTQCRNAYASQSWATNTELFNMTTNGIQLWTVPATATYTLQAVGARGGNGYTAYGFGTFGRGASMTTSVALEKNTVLKIGIGQQGSDGGGNSCGGDGGGGGATFVLYNANNQPIVVAGGGGSAGNNSFTTKHAIDSQSGQPGGGTNSGSGGTSGSAGDAGSGCVGLSGFGGAGISGNSPTPSGATSLNSTALGATGTVVGGFGGGGGMQQYGGGGGGGYSGGGGGGLPDCSCNAMSCGGAGGSYAINSYSFSSTGTGMGYLVVTKQ